MIATCLLDSDCLDLGLSDLRWAKPQVAEVRFDLSMVDSKIAAIGPVAGRLSLVPELKARSAGRLGQ